MEEEYRMQKAQVDINAIAKQETTAEVQSVRDSGVGTFGSSTDVGGADDDASIRGVASPNETKSELDAAPAIPTIRISTESDRAIEVEGQEPDKKPNGDTSAVTAAAEDTLGKPEQAATQEEGEDVTGDTATLNGGEAFSFSNKRLCERWLDNLFMVLYEVFPATITVHVILKTASAARICGYGRSSVPKLHTLKRNTWHTARLPQNGRFWVILGRGCTIRRRPRKLTSDA